MVRACHRRTSDPPPHRPPAAGAGPPAAVPPARRAPLPRARHLHGPRRPARHQQRCHQLPPPTAGRGGPGRGRSRALQRARPLVAGRPRRHLVDARPTSRTTPTPGPPTTGCCATRPTSPPAGSTTGSRRAQDWSPEWRDAADQSDYHLDLTPEALHALMADLHEVAAAATATPPPNRRTAPSASPCSCRPSPAPSAGRERRRPARRSGAATSCCWRCGSSRPGCRSPSSCSCCSPGACRSRRSALGTAAQGIVMLFLELPSGGLADALGRKPVLIAVRAWSG